MKNSASRYTKRKNFCPGTYIIVLFLFISNTWAGVLHSQTWNFIKEKEGIKVYTRQESASSLKSFRGETDLKTSIDKVFAIVGNIKSTDTWDPDIKEMRILSNVRDKSFSYYLIYGTPWPLQDRDLCVEAKITRDSVTGEIVILTQSRPSLVPETKDIVRIKNYWQKWLIQPLDKSHVRLILEGFADPAGNIPSWLYNMVITNTPMNMLLKIKEKVE
jgi:hypothetical protein